MDARARGDAEEGLPLTPWPLPPLSLAACRRDRIEAALAASAGDATPARYSCNDISRGGPRPRALANSAGVEPLASLTSSSRAPKLASLTAAARYDAKRSRATTALSLTAGKKYSDFNAVIARITTCSGVSAPGLARALGCAPCCSSATSVSASTSRGMLPFVGPSSSSGASS